MVWTVDMGAPCEARIGSDAVCARQAELLVEQGIGDEVGTRSFAERLDLPVPAREGNAEDGLTETGRFSRRRRALLRARSDETREIDVEPRIEIALERLSVERDQQKGGDGKHHERPRCRGGEQSEGERVRPHRSRRRGYSRARGRS